MADKTTFTTLQLNTTLNAAPNILGPTNLGTGTQVGRRAFVLLMNDDGDGVLEAGESAYVLGGQNNQNRLQNLGTLDTAADPVLITAHGRTGGAGNTGAVGPFTDLTRLGFNKDWGFGVDNGPNSDTRFMDLGDAFTFELTPRAGVQQQLTTVEFTIDTGGAAGTAELGLDFDGRLIKTGNYNATQTAANAEALLRLPGVQHNDKIVIDFVTPSLTVNGTARTGAPITDFFAAYASSPHNKITIGNIGAVAAGTPGFSLKALSLGRDDFAGPPANGAPDLTLTPVGTQPLNYGANASGPVTVASIGIVDDGVGLNKLSLAGADAQFFEINGNELRLKAGMAVFKPQLDVSVVVDDATINGTTPEDTENFSVAFAGANASTLGFGLVQLASVPGQTAAQTVASANSKVLGVGDVAAPGTNTGTQWRVLTAMFGDGDAALEVGESGYVVSGAAGSNQLANLALNTAADPVLISAHGQITNTNIGAITNAAQRGFNNTWGFGIDNGPDTNNRLLNNGDSYSFELADSGGKKQQFTKVSFVVDRSGLTNPTALVDVALDIDGTVINSTGSASPGTANALLRLSVAGGSTLVIDFVAKTVNGQQQAAFFTAFDAGPHNKLTIGSIAAGNQNTAGFSIGQLKIDRADFTPPSNGAPLGPMSDDQNPAENTVAENAANGTPVGITALAVDPDPTDTVTYSVNDNRFAVGTNGVVTVAGAIDAEAGESITVTVTATSSDGSPAQSKDFTITVTDVDEFDVGPIGDADTATANSVAWDVAAGTYVGYTASAVDADRTTDAITYSLDSNDGGQFAIDSTTGRVTVADGNLLPSGVHTITVRATSADTSFTSADVAITVEPPVYGTITLDGQLGANEWSAQTRLDTGASGNGVAGYAVYGTYKAGAFIVAISSDNVAIGQGTTIWFNSDLNRSTGFQVFGGTIGADYNIDFGADGHAKLYTGSAGQTFVANLAYGRSADGHGVEIALPSALLDGNPSVTELALDVNNNGNASLPNNFDAPYKFGAASITLTPVLTEPLRETTSTAQSIKVADIAATAAGAFELVKSGPNAGFFDFVQGVNGWELHLKAGTPLDFEAHPQGFGVTVGVDDLTTGGPLDPPEATANFAVAIADVDESQGSITLDGALGEWGASTRLDNGFNPGPPPTGNGAAGYAVYGTYEKAPVDAFVLAIQAPTNIQIGANTTVWFDTDLDSSTGFQVFGSTVGAEYNINFGQGGTASLYTGNTGDQGGTLVAANLDYMLNAERNVLEIALPSSLVGNARQANVYFDVNNAPFLPNDYANVRYLVGEKNLLPEDPTTRIAIVYSETTASRFFNTTAYGQLFMSAQHQAMQAGVPFDILSEDDLTSLANLTNAQGQLKYDAIVMPAFSHVQSSQVGAITDTLTKLVNDYDVGLITMGNFLSNNQSGAALPGNANARLESLLGVTGQAFGNGSSLVLRASDNSHPVSDRYANGDTVGTYNVGGYAAYQDVTGSGKTLFTQQVGGATRAAVIATENGGGRHVHFASDSVIGNNNILSEAIDWAARDDEPGNPISVGLQLTRGSSIFFSRTDMDQAQEYFDVVETNPGINDALLLTLQDWYQQYSFVGSYYVDIGAEPPDQQTVWTESLPVYQQMLAMENELGTHSFTHPANTNFLLKDGFDESDRQAWLTNLVPAGVRDELAGITLQQTRDRLDAALLSTNPATHQSNWAAQLAALSAADREILKGSYEFQFNYSRVVLEQQLNINVGGGAVPGAPEQRPATDAIMQYLDYLTGGGALVGAGYPGAFGFVDPEHQNKVYFAPNVSFDFTLIGFQGKSPAEAEAAWQQEYQNIVNHGTTPIIHWPWHDYGATNWPDEGQPGGYTLAMFTNFIERAYEDGTEFVTGADLAQRIESFVKTNVEISQVGGEIVVHVSGGSARGKFALEVDTSQQIAVVEDWYAYDGKKVFLATNGRTSFEIILGNQEADVTRIAKLPMRAELLQANGDGSDLAFNFRGKGDVVVDLKSGGGAVATGADTVTINGELMTLAFNSLGTHNVNIDHEGGAAAAVALAARTGSGSRASSLPQITGTAGDDFVFGSEQAMRIDGGRGSDQLFGGGGGDQFVFGADKGAETVLDFSLSADKIALVNSGFARAEEARAAFTSEGNDLRLSLSGADTLLIKNTALANLTDDHFVLDSLIS